jgi:hypothetical protein
MYARDQARRGEAVLADARPVSRSPDRVQAASARGTAKNAAVNDADRRSGTKHGKGRKRMSL